MNASELSYWHVSFVGNGSVERLNEETGHIIKRAISARGVGDMIECTNIEGAPVFIFTAHIAVMVWSTPETRATSYAIEAALEKEQEAHEPPDWQP
jgi:hypothetical protein